MARAIEDRLRDIIQALDDVADFSHGLTADIFLGLPAHDRKTYRALQAAFTQLGEAMKALPEEMTQRHPHIRWSGIAGLRDILVHHYHRVEIEVLWDVVSSDELHDLRTAVEKEMAAFG